MIRSAQLVNNFTPQLEINMAINSFQKSNNNKKQKTKKQKQKQKINKQTKQNKNERKKLNLIINIGKLFQWIPFLFRIYNKMKRKYTTLSEHFQNLIEKIVERGQIDTLTHKFISEHVSPFNMCE